MMGQRHINQTQFIFQNLFEKGFDEVFSERIADASYRNQLKKSVANFSTDCRQDIHLVPLNGLWTVVSGDGAEHYI